MSAPSPPLSPLPLDSNSPQPPSLQGGTTSSLLGSTTDLLHWSSSLSHLSLSSHFTSTRAATALSSKVSLLRSDLTALIDSHLVAAHKYRSSARATRVEKESQRVSEMSKLTEEQARHYMAMAEDECTRAYHFIDKASAASSRLSSRSELYHSSPLNHGRSLDRIAMVRLRKAGWNPEEVRREISKNPGNLQIRQAAFKILLANLYASPPESTLASLCLAAGIPEEITAALALLTDSGQPEHKANVFLLAASADLAAAICLRCPSARSAFPPSALSSLSSIISSPLHSLHSSDPFAILAALHAARAICDAAPSRRECAAKAGLPRAVAACFGNWRGRDWRVLQAAAECLSSLLVRCPEAKAEFLTREGVKKSFDDDGDDDGGDGDGRKGNTSNTSIASSSSSFSSSSSSSSSSSFSSSSSSSSSPLSSSAAASALLSPVGVTLYLLESFASPDSRENDEVNAKLVRSAYLLLRSIASKDDGGVAKQFDAEELLYASSPPAPPVPESSGPAGGQAPDSSKQRSVSPTVPTVAAADSGPPPAASSSSALLIFDFVKAGGVGLLVKSAHYHQHSAKNVALFLNAVHSLLFNHSRPHFALAGGMPQERKVVDLCLAAMVAQRSNAVIVWSALAVLCMLCDSSEAAIVAIEGWGKGIAGGLGDDDDDDEEEEDPNISVSYDDIDGCKLLVKGLAANLSHLPLQEQYCRLLTKMSTNLDGRMGLLRSDAISVLGRSMEEHRNEKAFTALAKQTGLALETGQ